MLSGSRPKFGRLGRNLQRFRHLEKAFLFLGSLGTLKRGGGAVGTWLVRFDGSRFVAALTRTAWRCFCSAGFGVYRPAGGRRAFATGVWVLGGYSTARAHLELGRLSDQREREREGTNGLPPSLAALPRSASPGQTSGSSSISGQSHTHTHSQILGPAVQMHNSPPISFCNSPHGFPCVDQTGKHNHRSGGSFLEGLVGLKTSPWHPRCGLWARLGAQAAREGRTPTPSFKEA